MTTQQIADRLVELCKKGDFENAQKELYAEDAVSIDPESSLYSEKKTKGLAGLLEKVKQFNSMIEEVHSISIAHPIIAGNAIALSLDMDTTKKGGGRWPISEICVYETKDGKIISEHFFW